MNTFRTTITLDDDSEVEVEVEYVYHRATRGARDSLGGKAGAGPPLEPDEPAEVEITKIVNLATGEELNIEPSESLLEQCFEHAEND